MAIPLSYKAFEWLPSLMKRQYSHTQYPFSGRLAINICYCERSHCSPPNIDNQQTVQFWIFIDNFRSNSNTKNVEEVSKFSHHRTQRMQNFFLAKMVLKTCFASANSGFALHFNRLKLQSLQFLIVLISVNNTQTDLNSAVLIQDKQPYNRENNNHPKKSIMMQTAVKHDHLLLIVHHRYLMRPTIIPSVNVCTKFADKTCLLLNTRALLT